MGYRHIDEMERERIAVLLSSGKRPADIARALGRARSSITREVARNSSCDASSQWGYFVRPAQRQSIRRAQRPRRRRLLVPGSRLWQPVMSKLRRGWSPQQIAYRLRIEYPDERDRWVSHQTIYHALEVLPRRELKAELKRHLRRQGKPAKARRAPLLGPSILERPAEAAHRQVPGHWEGDLIVGQGNRSAVGVMLERRTRYLLLVQLNKKDAFSVYQGFARKLKPVPAIFRQTLTYDRGAEMVEHRRLTHKVGIKVYFGDPHSPWQRASCENTNGLLRQYLPKSTDLSQFSQKTLNAIAERLNTRPRKTLGWYTPKEVYTNLLNELHNN